MRIERIITHTVYILNGNVDFVAQLLFIAQNFGNIFWKTKITKCTVFRFRNIKFAKEKKERKQTVSKEKITFNSLCLPLKEDFVDLSATR